MVARSKMEPPRISLHPRTVGKATVKVFQPHGGTSRTFTDAFVLIAEGRVEVRLKAADPYFPDSTRFSFLSC